MKKEKTVKTHTRKTKSGKTVTVKQHTAKYEAAEDIVKEALKRKKGAGGELEQLKKKKAVKPEPVAKEDIYSEYGFTKDEFAEWYEGTGSKADKKVEKILRKAMGRKAYNELSDSAADNYKKGGANGFFKKSLKAMKETTSSDSSKKSGFDNSKSFKANFPKELHKYLDVGDFCLKKKPTKEVTKAFKAAGFDIKYNPVEGLYEPVDSKTGLLYREDNPTKSAGGSPKKEKTPTKEPTKKSKLPPVDEDGYYTKPVRKVDSALARRYARDEDIDLKTARDELSKMPKKLFDRINADHTKETARSASIGSSGQKSVDSAMREPFRGAGKRLTGKDATAGKKALLDDGFVAKKDEYGRTYLKKGSTIYEYIPAGSLIGGAHLMRVKKGSKEMGAAEKLFGGASAKEPMKKGKLSLPTEGQFEALQKALDRKGYYVHRTSSGSLEVYKKGDRKALKNLKAAISYSEGGVSWGPNRDLEKSLGGVVNEALANGLKSSPKSGGTKEEYSKAYWEEKYPKPAGKDIEVMALMGFKKMRPTTFTKGAIREAARNLRKMGDTKKAEEVEALLEK